ncbi:MAG: helix-turn-helix transcriptional regulator [Candidatus Aminicenantaceae bacterium]
MVDLALIKPRLMGPNFKRLLKSLSLTKWRVSKDCNITYRTLINWQAGKTTPSDELAIRVGKYLGIIGSKEQEIMEIKKQMKELQDRIERLSE